MRLGLVILQVLIMAIVSTLTAVFVVPSKVQDLAETALNLLGVLLAAFIALMAVIATLVPVIGIKRADRGAVQAIGKDQFLAFLRNVRVDAGVVLGATISSFVLYALTKFSLLGNSIPILRLVAFVNVLALFLSLSAVWDLFGAVFRLQEEWYKT